MKCAQCPCAGRCVEWPVFCAWAATGDPVLLAHIRHRSEHGPARRDTSRPEVRESIALTRAMNDCPHRTKLPGCCTAAACALKGGATVSHLDCFACLKAQGLDAPCSAPRNG